jgi:hypothetical protein
LGLWVRASQNDREFRSRRRRTTPSGSGSVQRLPERRDPRRRGRRGHGQDRFVGRDLDQVVLQIDAVIFVGRQRRGRVDHQRGMAGRELHHQPMGRRASGGVAIELERQCIADFDPDPGIARGVRLVDRREFNAHQLFPQGRRAVGVFGIHRLEAAGRQRRQGDHGQKPSGDAGSSQRHSRSSWEQRSLCGRHCHPKPVLPHRAPKRQPQFPDFGPFGPP